MKIDKLDNFLKGWLIGDFDPTLYKTPDCELGINRHKAGTVHEKHYHRFSNEINILISGECSFIFDKKTISPKPFDVITVQRNERVRFEAHSDVIMIVFRDRSIKGDKYTD